ncbi:MAG: rhodanese-like domain-containing protein [Anaerolineae bacterium]|nr:rhodanese-like domain-containing protein [Anaerolineae bacterium]
MKQIMALLIITFTLVLTACGSQTEPKPAEAEDFDLANLPADVDVSTTAALLDNPDVVLIDVREPAEYNESHIPGITLIPMGEVASRLDEIPHDKTVIVSCRSGNRSSQVTNFLRDNGYDNVHNMKGGIMAWEQAGFEVEK